MNNHNTNVYDQPAPWYADPNVIAVNNPNTQQNRRNLRRFLEKKIRDIRNCIEEVRLDIGGQLKIITIRIEAERPEEEIQINGR